MENIDLLIILVMSVLTFILFAVDKHRAVYGSSSRVSEATLFTASFLGGAFGALCAMIFFSHKTLHKSFLSLIPLFVVINLAADILYRLYVM